MKNINGQGNEITIILPHKKIDCIIIGKTKCERHKKRNAIIRV